MSVSDHSSERPGPSETLITGPQAEHRPNVQEAEGSSNDANINYEERNKDYHVFRREVEAREDEIRRLEEELNSTKAHALARIEHLEKEVHTSDDEIQLLKKEFNTTQDQISARIGQLDKDLETVKIKLTEKSNLLKARKTELAKKTRDLQDAEAALAEKTRDLETVKISLDEKNNNLNILQEDADEKARECEDIRSNWMEAITELDVVQSSKKRLVVDDTSLQSQWSTLVYMIKDLVAKHFFESISSNTSTRSRIHTLNHLSLLWQQFLQTKDFSHYIFQAMIWHVLYDEIFRDPSALWGKDIGSAASKLFNSVSATDVDRKTYHSWRADTGDILQSCYGIDEDTCRAILGLLFTHSRPYVKFRDHSRVEKALNAVVRGAVDLASIFNQSVAKYVVYRAKDGQGNHFNFRYRPGSMEDVVEAREKEVVMLISSPALVKYGDSKGENYGDYTVLSKAKVFRA